MRIRVLALFCVAFVATAFVTFAVASAAGAALSARELPLPWRQAIAGAFLIALAGVDIYAARRKTYCPISWRRQTPRVLMRRFSPPVVALVWGLDTGFAVTTFRVSAATWGALFLTFLGFGPWWIGIGYGVAFVVPLACLIWMGRVGEAAAARDPLDPGLDKLLEMRSFAQLSAALLLGLSALIVPTFGAS
jgi:hypothetical protein